MAGAALSFIQPDAALATESETPTITLPNAFAADHAPKPLDFDPAKLNGLSEKLIRSHWENNYGGSVKALNAVKQKLSVVLEDGNLPAYIYNDLKREHLLRTGSVVLHELYFANLGGGSGRVTLDLNLHTGTLENYWHWDHQYAPTASVPILVLDMYEHSYQMDYGAAG